MSNSRKIKGIIPRFSITDELKDVKLQNSLDGDAPFEVPLTTTLIDGKKRVVGTALVTKQPDGSYTFESKIEDPEAIAMLQDTE